MNLIPRLLSHPSFAALPFAVLLSGLAAGCEPAADDETAGATQALSAGSAAPAGSIAAAEQLRDRGPRAKRDLARDGRGMGPAGRPGRGGPPDPAKLFARWDADGDGKVALKELPERAQERLGDADQDGDGSLTSAEVAAFHAKRWAEHRAEADTNGDGTVSDAEREAMRERHHAERFAAADKNGDGALTQDEVDARRWAHLAAADADGDQRVTRAELDAAFAAGKMGPPPHRGHGGRPCAGGCPGDGAGPRGGNGPRDGTGPGMSAPAPR